MRFETCLLNMESRFLQQWDAMQVVGAPQVSQEAASAQAERPALYEVVWQADAAAMHAVTPLQHNKRRLLQWEVGRAPLSHSWIRDLFSAMNSTPLSL